MSYSIWFLVILVLVSGFIAYWGDLLGRRMGKRRLTLFNLRPKHTAIIVTTITGMVIAGLTLGTMLAADRQLRELLVRGDEIIEDNSVLNKRNADLRAELRTLNERQDGLTDRLESMLDQVQDATDAEREAKSKQILAEEKAGKLSTEVKRRARSLAQLESRFNQMRTQYDQRKTLLDKTSQSLDQTRKQLLEVDRDYRIAAEIAQRSRMETRLYQAGLDRMAQSRIIARQSEEILRAVIQPSEYALQDIEALLNRASDLMIQRGAKKGVNGRGVAIVPKGLVLPADAKGSRKPVLVTESDSIEGHAKAIEQSPIEVVVIVVAARNCVAGEQATVDLETYNNKVAFYKGEEIALTKLDGSTAEWRVYSELVRFLRTDVRAAARRAGVIPTDDPEAVFGEISDAQLEEFTGIVDRIKSLNEQVTVRIVAQEDIHAAGPMNLSNMDFVIVGSSASASRGM